MANLILYGLICFCFFLIYKLSTYIFILEEEINTIHKEIEELKSYVKLEDD